MPTYQFACHDCRTEFEEKRSFAHASDPAACPSCGGTHTRKQLTAVAFISDRAGGSTAAADSIPLSMGGGCACGGACGCGH